MSLPNVTIPRATVGILLAGVLVATASDSATAQVTRKQRQELIQLNRQSMKVGSLLRAGSLNAAETLLTESQKKLKDLVKGGVPQRSRVVRMIGRRLTAAQRVLMLQKQRMQKKQQKGKGQGGKMPQKPGAPQGGKGVSFTEDVAPIITKHCVGCHGGAKPKAGLNLSTYAGWEKGGASKQPLSRVLLPRLTAPGRQRMPKGKPPLSKKEIYTIARWLRQGAQFDGDSKMTPLGELEKMEEKKEMKPVTINRPSGDETVFFTKDVAPFMVKICGKCHISRDPKGEFSMATFEGLMRGGASGEVIIPGKPEQSRLWLMVSNKVQPRMPPGQRRITRDNYDALTTWIKEGAVFDGKDPKAPLAKLVPSGDEKHAKMLASFSPQEWVAYRKKQSQAHWERAFPQQSVKPVETPQFLIYADTPQKRIDQVKTWAKAHLKKLRATFGANGTPLWKGKLTIYLLKDRFSYREFALSVNNRRQIPDDIHGHAIVSPDLDEAYIVLEDIGDTPSATSPGMKANLINMLTQAYVSQMGGMLPQWAVQGSGLYMASQASPENPFFQALSQKLTPALSGVSKPQQLFEEGTFSPAQAPAVNLALVEFLIQGKGAGQFAKFLKQLAGKPDLAQAVRGVYGTTPVALARMFASSAAAMTRRQPQSSD